MRSNVRPAKGAPPRASAAPAPRAEPLERRALLSGGDADPTFGGAGGALLALDQADGSAPRGRSVAVQADGRVVVVGAAAPAAGVTGFDFAVTRLRADGTPDPTFGPRGTGTAYTDFAGGYDEAFAVAVQADGRVVAAGSAAVARGRAEQDIAVARYLPDGRPDPAFGPGGSGRVTVSLGAGSAVDESARALAVQPDGRIVLAGTTPEPGAAGGHDIAVARLNADGSLDPTFGDVGTTPGQRTGKRRIAVGGADGDECAFGLAIDTNGGALAANTHYGTILVAGQDGLAGARRDFLVLRLEPDGDLDPTFGAGGQGLVDFPGYTAPGAAAVAVAPDDGVIAAGYGTRAGTTGDDDMLVARLKPDGTPDAKFGPGGGGGFAAVSASAAAGGMDRANDVRLAPDGGILLAGFTTNAAGGAVGAVVRLTPDGSPDPRWPPPSGAWTDPAAYRYYGLAAAPDGRLVAAGPNGTSTLVRRLYDLVPVVTLTAPDASAAEAGADPGSFRFTLDRPAPFDVRVAFEVGGTATPPGDATAGDYAAAADLRDRAVLIPAGRTEATLTVTPVDDADAESTETVELTLAPGPAYAVGGTGKATVTIADNDSASLAAAVVARHVFYNRSIFDGNDPAANAADDAAIAADKSALRPGGAATFANVTSYPRGLNGVMIDVARLPADAEANLTIDDFAFRSGKTPDPSTWPLGPGSASVSIRRSAGDGGTDRVTLVWPDYNPQSLSPVAQAVTNAWLQVTMKANAHTGLAAPDLFYFGNLIGEVGDPLTPLNVTAADFTRARFGLFSPAPIDARADFDRDGRVTALDLLTVRQRMGTPIPTLTPPVAVAPLFSSSLTILKSLAARRASEWALLEASR